MRKELDTGEESDLKRYNLAVPEELFNALRVIADLRGESMASLIRRFIQLGLEVEGTLARGGSLIKKQGEKETELIII